MVFGEQEVFLKRRSTHGTSASCHYFLPVTFARGDAGGFPPAIGDHGVPYLLQNRENDKCGTMINVVFIIFMINHVVIDF